MTVEQLAVFLELSMSDTARRAGVTVYVDEADGSIAFRGRTGNHSLALSVSPPERIRAHFRGFCENQEVPS